jgi:hypothetical protein
VPEIVAVFWALNATTLSERTNTQMLTSSGRALIDDLKRWAIFLTFAKLGFRAEPLYGVLSRNPWKATDELLSYVS